MSSVTLELESVVLNAGDNLTVTQGDLTALQCSTGTSRPPAQINWFIGGQSLSATGKFVEIVFNNSDHKKTIYCTAINSQPTTEVVTSQILNLYVRGEYHL